MHQRAAAWAPTGRQEAGGPTAAAERDDDLPLLRAGEAGDTRALERLLARHERALCLLCGGMLVDRSTAGARHTLNGAEAEDAVQETFLRALRALHAGRGFRGDSTVRTWLFRIAINVCLEWRRRARFSPFPSFLALDDVDAHAADPGPSPEAAVLRAWQAREALRVLPPRHRALLLLKEREGWSVREIAAAMGWTDKKVHNELYKARVRLAEWRAAQEIEERNGR